MSNDEPELKRRETDRLTESERAFESLTPSEMAFFKKLFLANKFIKMIVVPLLMVIVFFMQAGEKGGLSFKWLEGLQ